MRPLSSKPTRKLVAHSTSTAFPDIGLARAAFFSDCGCRSVSAWIQTRNTRMNGYVSATPSREVILHECTDFACGCAARTISDWRWLVPLHDRRGRGGRLRRARVDAEDAGYLSQHGETVQFGEALCVSSSCWQCDTTIEGSAMAIVDTTKK